MIRTTIVIGLSLALAGAATARQPQGLPYSLFTTYEACGLDFDAYELSRRLVGAWGLDFRPENASPGFVRLDVDGDGADDYVVPVERRRDGAVGMAFCLQDGQRLILAGYDGMMGDVRPDYFELADMVGVHEGEIMVGITGEPPPTAAGDALVLAIAEASSVVIFLTPDGEIDGYWQGD